MVVNPSHELPIPHICHRTKCSRSRAAPPRAQKDKHPESSHQKLPHPSHMPRRPKIHHPIKHPAPVKPEGHRIGVLRRAAEEHGIPPHVAIPLQAPIQRQRIRDILGHRIAHKMVLHLWHRRVTPPRCHQICRDIKRGQHLASQPPWGKPQQNQGHQQNAGRPPRRAKGSDPTAHFVCCCSLTKVYVRENATWLYTRRNRPDKASYEFLSFQLL